MAYQQLPFFPRFVFTVFEPISLVAGSVPAILWPGWFIDEQLKQPLPLVSSENSLAVAQQLGNAYGLLSLIGLAVLYTTSELNVVRNYIIALLLGDIGHVYVTYQILGYGRFVAVSQWNSMTIGNIGVTICLGLTRTAWLLGFFGPNSRASTNTKKTKQA